MIKLKLQTLFFGLIFSTILYGQYSDFDLSKYQLPDIKTNRLDLNFNMGNNGNRNRFQYTNVDTSENRHNNYQGAINLDYYNFRNSEKYQGDLAIRTFMAPQFNGYLNDNLERKFKSIISDFIILSNNKFYNQNMNFIEVDPYMTFFMNNSRENQDITSTLSHNDNYASFTSSFSIPVSVGHGRIEPVEDLRLAIYIIEELNKTGKISKMPSEKVIIEMAREISKIKKKRFFDSRIRKIHELQVIDSFIVANNLISSDDIDYFSVLNDQWDYAYGPPRLSGLSYNIGFDNSASVSKEYHTTITGNNDPVRDNSSLNNYKAGGFFKIIYAKPINLYWQTSGSLKTSYNLVFTVDPNNKDSQVLNYRSNLFRTDLNYSLQFLPNSRTSFEFQIDAMHNNVIADRTTGDIDPVNYKQTNNIFSINPGLDIYYYISPQLRIQFSSSISVYNSIDLTKYENSYNDNELIMRDYRNSFSLNLIYSFF